MPLLDHFRPPVALDSVWESFHARWAVAIANDLNARLPRRFIAEAPIRLGVGAAADVAEFETAPGGESSRADADGGLAGLTFAPPQPAVSMPNVFPPDVVAVEVRDTRRSRQLVAAVELVSPANKDRPDSREVFAAKSAGYVLGGVGLVIVDIVTDMHFNLHNAFVRLGRHDDQFLMPEDQTVYAVAYRPVHRKGQDLVDIWRYQLAVGTPLPPVPLALRGTGVTIALDLEATYTEACRWARLT